MNDLRLSDLRIANLRRLPQFRDGRGELCHKPVFIDNVEQPAGFDWPLSQWSNATLGELGEAANIIKKIERGDFTLEEKREALGKEFADVLIYLDIMAHRAGINLAEAVVNKFNEVSERVGANVVFARGEIWSSKAMPIAVPVTK